MTFDSAPSQHRAPADVPRLFPSEQITGKKPLTSIEKAGRAMARAAGLRYVRDADGGMTRKRRNGSFVYVDADGARVRSAAEIQRINSLAIPPAYESVWICPDPDGHIQATARDARGRKQYRYHPRWQAIRTVTKFERMVEFGQALPRIRRTVSRLLRLDGMPREKVLAAVIQLLDVSLIRVGNDEYARQNRSYGLTTLLTRHVRVNGSTMQFDFRGKGRVVHRITVRHQALAGFIRDCLAIPGRELFQYLDENGRRHAVNSTDVNAFLQSIAGANFTAKDFRTWGGSTLALREMMKQPQATTVAQHKKATIATIKSVAELLGNTPAVCRKSYIHPRVLECRPETLPVSTNRQPRGLRRYEAGLIEMLAREM